MSSLSSATWLLPESELDSNVVERAWVETVERRLGEVGEGGVPAVSGDEVFAALGASVDLR